MKLIENKKKVRKITDTRFMCFIKTRPAHDKFSSTDKITAFSFISEKIQILGMISAQIKKSKFQKMLVFRNNT